MEKKSPLCKMGLLLMGIVMVSGCATLGPIPDSPEEFTEVYIDSIPSGADVYDVNPKDGNLGGRVGVTPYLLRVGFATAKWDTGRRNMSQTNLWGAGCSWSDYRSDVSGWDVLLNLAVVKDGYYPGRITNKRLGTIGWGKPYPPQGTRITVPLRPARAQETGGAQQQQQQQQTIVVPGATSETTAAKGTVMVVCEVQDAEVKVDGAFVGNAPANLMLSEGIHIIEVSKAGFKPYRKEVRVLGGSELTLRVTLQK